MVLTGNYKHQSTNHRAEPDEVYFHDSTESLNHSLPRIHGCDSKMMGMVHNGQE
jgi:hypothetical protein